MEPTYLPDRNGWLYRLLPFSGTGERLICVNSPIVAAVADDETIYANLNKCVTVGGCVFNAGSGTDAIFAILQCQRNVPVVIQHCKWRVQKLPSKR